MNLFYKFLSVISWPFMWLLNPLRLRASAVIIHDNKMLLVKHKIGSGHWNLPGGGVKIGESAVDAAKREVAEELGLKFAKNEGELLNEEFIITKKRGILTRHQFVLLKLKKDQKITTNHEIRTFEWRSLEVQGDEPEIFEAKKLLRS